MKDFYYILGVDVNCTSIEIREAYRKLSKKFHPDLNENDNYFESRFRAISEAYETLSDPVSRAKYDAELKKGKSYPSGKEPKKQLYASKTKGVDMAFTLMLILITVVFGYYVVHSISGSKKPKVHKEIAAVPKSVHHKKRHGLKSKSNNVANNLAKANVAPVKPIIKPTKIIADTIKPLHPVQSIAANTPAKPVQPAVTPTTIKPEAKPIQPIATNIVKPAQPVVVNTATARPIPPVTAVTPEAKPAIYHNADYTAIDTYIKSNATGVVYMRKLDDYNSDVVNVIPTNSKVSVLEKGNTFYKVLFNNKTGYVPKWTVQGK